MKKIFSLLLIVAVCISLCACGENPTAGKYREIGMFSNAEYELKKNEKFKADDSTKGTYVLNTDDSIWFTCDEGQGFQFMPVDDYYYKSDVYGGFSEDTSEDMNPPMFNEKNRSDQSFYKGVDKTYYALNLKEDGTYTASIEEYDENYSLVSKKEFEGTYKLKGKILWLTHGKNKYPMIYETETLYYNVIEKVEEK